METLATLWNALVAWPWSMIAAVLSSIAVSILVWVNFIRPARKRKKLRVPVDAIFVVHKTQHHYTCQFAKQDDLDHELKTIVLPSNSTVIVDLVFKPRTFFRATEYYLGCDGDGANTKPVITRYLNRFIEKGDGKEIIPGPGNKHMIDVYGYYHKRDDQIFSVSTPIATAFVLETKSSGSYQFNINFTGDEFRGQIRDLMIVVEDTPKTVMRCAIRKHRRLTCRKEGIHPLPRD